MKKIIVIIVFLFDSGSVLGADYSSPQSALLSLEKAYAEEDLDSAVAAKNFYVEAREMLKNIKNINNPDEQLIQETAHVLELSFRNYIKNNGFPDFKNIKCSILKTKKLSDEIVELTEKCVFADGDYSIDKIHAARKNGKWGIIILPSKEG